MIRHSNNYQVALWADKIAQIARWMKEDEQRLASASRTSPESLPFLRRIQSHNEWLMDRAQANFQSYQQNA